MTLPLKSTPRIEYLRVQRFRALHDLELKDVTPLAVFLGANGSGKSTLFDVFAFLSECFNLSVRKAWDKRGRFHELRTRGVSGPIEFTIKYREQRNSPLITYFLKISEENNNPVVEEEWLQWKHGAHGKPFRFLDFKRGEGRVVTGELPDEQDQRQEEKLRNTETLAVNTLGQLAKNPRVSALREFISGWYLSYLSADSTRGVPEAGPQERLTDIGDNLPNVIQYLNEQYPERLKKVLDTLAQRVPRLEKVGVKMLEDGRLLLQIKDAPFEQPILSKFASDGTLKMLAYLTLLYDPNPPRLIGIEEPENQLHPRLLPELCEECRNAAGRSQLMVTTHSPFFVSGLKANEVWALYRDEKGYTQALRAKEMKGINEFMEQGAKLGDLWTRGFFEVGSPTLNVKPSKY
jgi:predicted ATPase